MCNENKESTAVTGVISNNNITYLHDEICYGDAINLDYEQYVKDGYDPELYEENGDTYVIGYYLDETDGLYDVDKNAIFSAIVGPTYTQVTHSNVFAMCYKCSPCYPNQGDLETPGDILTFALPTTMFDNEIDVMPYKIIK